MTIVPYPQSTMTVNAAAARPTWIEVMDRGSELASVRSLFPVVAEDPGVRELGNRDLRLAGAVGAHQAHVLPGTERPL